jgi:hypothetical protein
MICGFTWDTFFNLLQGIGAIASAVIAWYVLQQGKKIKSLTDVVSELKNSNSILKKRFENEKIITKKDRMPIFVKAGEYTNKHQLWIKIQIKNIGINAVKIEPVNIKNGDCYTIANYEKKVDNNAQFEIEIKITLPEKMDEPPIDFYLKFESYFGIEHTQRIHKIIGSDIQIDLPDDFINI